MNFRHAKTFLLGAIALCFLASHFGYELNSYQLDVAYSIGISIIMAVSLNLINGYTGQFSLGHAGFMAVGAYVAGYMASNDLSARDRGRRPNVSPTSVFKMDWTKHKTFEGSCPIGPWIVPASDIADPQNLRLKLWVNGELKQDSNTGKMLFTLAEQIEQLSINMTLHPGDLILTGTPSGTGAESGTFLKAGDVVKAWVENIGEIENRMV